MQFPLLDLPMNDLCDRVNFTHLTELMLLQYLVKVKTLQNVILQCDITKENCTNAAYSFIEMDL